MKRIATILPQKLLLFAALLFTSMLQAQGWYDIYQKEVSGYEGDASVVTALPGGYVMVGSGSSSNYWDLTAFLVDLDGYIFGEIPLHHDFFYPYDKETLVAAPDGGFTLLAEKNVLHDSTLLIHVNANGTLGWERALTTSGKNVLQNLKVLDNGDYLVSGTARDSALFMRISPQGNTVWRLTYGRPGALINQDPFSYRGLSPSGPNTFIQHFMVDTLPTQLQGLKDTLIHINISGYFEPSYPSYWPSAIYEISDVFEQPDGNYLAFGSASISSGVVKFRRMDTSGNVIFTQSSDLTPNGGSFGNNYACPTSDGGIVFASSFYLSQYGQDVIILTKCDEWGNYLWRSEIPFQTFESGVDDYTLSNIAQAPDGGILITGTAYFPENKPFIIHTDAQGRIKPATVAGQIAAENNGNCILDSSDAPFEGCYLWLQDAAATQPKQFIRSAEAGRYAFQADTNTLYQLQITVPNDYWEPCLSDTAVSAAQFGDTVLVNVPAHPLVNCPFLETDIGVDLLRRCQSNTYVLRYCNTGTVQAENAYVVVELDPDLNIVSADKPYTPLSGNRWRFDLGVIPVGDCDAFRFQAFLDCDANLGETKCAEAHIYPDSLCLSAANWSGANVEVEGQCDPDSVRFVIRNNGTATTSLLDYIIIEDNIIFFQGNFTLPAGDSLVITLPANGSTWRVESEQEPGSPGNPMPSDVVEGCGLNAFGFFSIGFVPQFGESDGDPFVSIDCQTIVGSYDPNDKQASPAGYGDQHLIEPGQPLEYTIRFQNTGTDTAFRVVVRDTLPAWLDPLSVVPGAAGHPYHFDIRGNGVLVWTFEDILLPDSNVNEPASHGFLKFRVAQKPGVPLGAVIANTAAIYFDFNAPVITNSAWHTIGHNFVPTGLSQAGNTLTPTLQVSPNPAPAGAGALWIGGAGIEQGELTLYNALGRPVAQAEIENNHAYVQLQLLPPGIYQVRVFEQARLIGWSRLFIE